MWNGSRLRGCRFNNQRKDWEIKQVANMCFAIEEADIFNFNESPMHVWKIQPFQYAFTAWKNYETNKRQWNKNNYC